MADRSSRPPPNVPSTDGSASAIGATVLLPDSAWDEHWNEIIISDSLRDRILGQAVFSLTAKEKLNPVVSGVHGLILMAGAPGTGKSTISRGLANQIAKEKRSGRFAEVNPHALPSDMLGQSQRAIIRLFDHDLPLLPRDDGSLVLLIEEVEAFAVSRSEASLKANPVDVHRATDAILEGLDRAAIAFPNLLVIGTTNFEVGIDEAFVSRADAIFHFPLPDEAARVEILKRTLRHYATVWPALINLADGDPIQRLAEAAVGLTGRDLKKLVARAAAVDLSVAREPGRLTIEHLRQALKDMTSDRRNGS